MKNLSKIIIGISLGTGLLWLKYSTTVLPDARSELLSIYEKYNTNLVSKYLLRALAIVESSENPLAYNPNDPSYGLMQILWNGKNKFYVDGWPPGENGKELYYPDYNVFIGSQIINYNVKKYGLFRGIICYNNWNARKGVIPLKSWNYFMKVFITMKRLEGLG